MEMFFRVFDTVCWPA